MDAIAFTKNGIKLIEHTKPQKNSRFKKLQRRAEKIDFYMDRTEDTYSPYEIWSDTFEKGTTYCCLNLNEVEMEINSLELRYGE